MNDPTVQAAVYNVLRGDADIAAFAEDERAVSLCDCHLPLAPSVVLLECCGWTISTLRHWAKTDSTGIDKCHGLLCSGCWPTCQRSLTCRQGTRTKCATMSEHAISQPRLAE